MESLSEPTPGISLHYGKHKFFQLWEKGYTHKKAALDLNRHIVGYHNRRRTGFY